MPTRVHAVIVARSGASAHARLLQTLDALAAQTQPLDAITLVVCGNADKARTSPEVAALVEGIIEAKSTLSFVQAFLLAYPRVGADRALWVLDQGSVPDPNAIEQLAGALERSPSAAIAAPKLVRAERPDEIVSLGVTMTTLGRTVELAAEEIDQGQHDRAEDVLGADIRGILIRAEARPLLRPDPALHADEGLDLGVRARLMGARLVLTPAARIGVADTGPAAPRKSQSMRALAARRAQLHRRLAYAPGFAVMLHWLSLLPLAMWRTVVDLIAKRPAHVLPEWAAAFTTMVKLPAVAKSRAQIRLVRRLSWASIKPLRITQAALRRRLDDGHGSEAGAISELRFFSGGGAWAVLAALLVSIASFTALLAWPALGGGGLLPLRETVTGLWRDASWGLRGIGVDVIGPADPFSGVLALIGSLWPWAPSFALVLVWLLALPLAVLGGWFAATRMTDRAGLRIFGGVAWALAPTFLTALVDGRPAAVLVHLLLPWLLHTALAAPRSWGAAGAASLILLGVLACAPSLAPALVLLWLLGLIVVIARGWVRSAFRVLWLVIPTAVIVAPLVSWQVQHNNVAALFADPGLIWQGPQVLADTVGRLTLAQGYPTGDFARWAGLVPDPLASWVPLLLAPLAVLALAAALSPRWLVGIGMLVTAAAGLGTAMLAVGVQVSFAQGAPVAIWPGSALSLAWLGVVGAALVTLDTVTRAQVLRSSAAVVATIALCVAAVPALTAMVRGDALLTNGPTSTLPAYAAAEARGDHDLGTLTVLPRNDGALAARVIWGPSATLGAQATIVNTATTPVGTDIAPLAVDLLSTHAFDAAEQLAALGVRFVLLQQDADETEAAREYRLSAITALDQRAGFLRVGETTKGVLWRVDLPVSDRAQPAAADRRHAQLVLSANLIALAAAVLLAIPTRASRRAARSRSRVFGLSAAERREPPIRRPHSLEDGMLTASEDDTMPVAPVAEGPGDGGDLPAEAGREGPDETDAGGKGDADAPDDGEADAEASVDVDLHTDGVTVGTGTEDAEDKR